MKTWKGSLKSWIKDKSHYLSSLKPRWYLAAYLILILIYGALYQASTGTIEGVCSWFDGYYFSIVTATTLGFGDLRPVTFFGKALVSSQVFFEVLLIGFFLNSLAFQLSERVKGEEETKILEEKERLRKGLDRHLSLLVESAQSGNPLIWDKHAQHCSSLQSHSDYITEIIYSLKNLECHKPELGIKALLESADQMYDTYVSLLPVAANISPIHLLKWSSVVSNIRNLRDQYRSAKEKFERQELEGCHSEKEQMSWPGMSSVAFQVQELFDNVFFFKEEIRSMDDLARQWKSHEESTI